MFFFNLRNYIGIVVTILGIHPQTPSHHIAHVFQPVLNTAKKAANLQLPSLPADHPMHPDNTFPKPDKAEKADKTPAKVDKGKVRGRPFPIASFDC